MSKPPKQTHLEYLLTTIENDMDTEISVCGKVFRQSREALVAGRMSNEEVRQGLEYLTKLVIPTTNAKHHAEKLFKATIDYIIDPDKVLNADVVFNGQARDASNV